MDEDQASADNAIVPLAYLRDLCRYWAEHYDWRRTEARLNAPFRAVIDGSGSTSCTPAAASRRAPLVLTHGWPSSIAEFLQVIEPLCDPPALGGDAADAFHVVCPSLPGYGFSDKPAAPGWGIERIATAWITLMAPLGYTPLRRGRRRPGHEHQHLYRPASPEARVTGIHLFPPLAPPDPVVTTQPASTSQQNVQRRGFDLLYTRAVLVKQP